jgi:threonine aldolase
MRQAGILAAAGLIALEEGPTRLHEDHANARLLAERLAALPQLEIDLEAVRTNIVIFTLRNKGNAAALVDKLKARGILAGTVGRHSVRFVTHLDVNRAACEEAARVATELIAV